MKLEIPTVTGALRPTLERTGAAVVRVEDGSRAAAASPWAFAERLFGERVLLVERQPIRTVAGGRTFASSGMLTPLHTDSQCHVGVPASAQVLVCARPAEAGGESTLVDAFDLVTRLASEDPRLAARLFDETRTIPFYFGDFVGPTMARRRGHLFFTHAPVPSPRDAVGDAVQAYVDRSPRAERRLVEGDVIVVNNHRVLHGRRPFDGTTRSLVRLLVWLEAPWAAPPDLVGRARADATPPDPLASRKLAVVLELLRGVPPGVVASREGLAESVLYRWREDALRGAGAALDRD